MDESKKNSPCEVCRNRAGTVIFKEVELLREHLAERDTHVIALETEFLKYTKRTNDLEEQVGHWREKYERLYDSHKRVQKLNQVLEDKLLQMVDKMKGEKSQLTKDIATLSVRLAESKHNYSMLQKENERYKNDMNLAIQLLQCKPDNFVSQKLDNLPVDTQARVSQYVMSKTPKATSSNQSKNGNDIDTFDASEYEFNISASLMSKILEDSIQDSVTKHCDTCTCSKTQSKPFCYNESYYTVATQTLMTGEFQAPLCSHCNTEIKSMNSILSIRSDSPHKITLVNEKTINTGLYILPHDETPKVNNNVDHEINEIMTPNDVINELLKPDEKIRFDLNGPKDNVLKINEDINVKKVVAPPPISLEPSIHHKLCDRTRNSISSKKSSIQGAPHHDLHVKELPNDKDVKPEAQYLLPDTNKSIRKGSLGSMGVASRTSSIAKSTVSTHKSNTQVGPGPRFCHLRMQAGSKNILLDNAEPDVPPVLYRRQSKCHENNIFKDLTDGLDNFIDLDRNDDSKDENKNDNVVVESTLIDVHVDSNNKEVSSEVKNGTINPILLNVSSSPLQPLKTHNFLNSTECNNNTQVGNPENVSEIDTLLSDLIAPPKITPDSNETNEIAKPEEVPTPNDNQEIKIFNFDRYEQSKVDSQFARPLKKIDMSKLHSIENTKISKDCPPLGADIENNVLPKPSTANIVNVYPNLTQTHLKVNETKKVFTNEQSTSSLSSDDSAAMLQKQQLLRVAEWVEKNLEQSNINDPLEEESSYSTRIARRESKINRLTETLNELALNMPHPVSKFSKSYSRDARTNWVHNLSQDKHKPNAKIANVVKETIFPVESDEKTVTEVNNKYTSPNSVTESDIAKDIREVLSTQKGDKRISPEDLARMEYNVKKFLLSGPYWANPSSSARSRRTSSKTETDV
ncbi:uncharacterized protein LOC121734880 [Aricia agestis]|uniref:uncharacterized protein LOC121734880 n=1 Tax=Aricia agestis TaxID=91739 RepID=UPI001C20AE89|nr:uncharacterized protein LOC121734880 [Aricia agestis]